MQVQSNKQTNLVAATNKSAVHRLGSFNDLKKFIDKPAENRVIPKDTMVLSQPAAPAVPAKPAPAAAQAQEYTVASGDTLYGIAKKVLGNGERWPEIYDLNKDRISNPNVIVPGMKIRLQQTTAPAAPAASHEYTVASGDTLSGIAQKVLGNGDRWPEIYDLNKDRISNPDVISQGMNLRLPGAGQVRPTQSSSGPNTNREAIYVRQPNGWTCAPASLAMALAAFGARPANVNTVNEMVSKTGTTSDVGLPGNASLIASAAKAAGMKAEFHADASAASVRESLKQGKGVVLNGSVSGSGGHFIYVAGIASDGRFIVCDPYRPEITRWNDGELQHFATGYSVNPRGFAAIWK